MKAGASAAGEAIRVEVAGLFCRTRPNGKRFHQREICQP